MATVYNYFSEIQQVNNGLNLISNKYKIPESVENIISSFYENEVIKEFKNIKNNYKNIIEYEKNYEINFIDGYSLIMYFRINENLKLGFYHINGTNNDIEDEQKVKDFIENLKIEIDVEGLIIYNKDELIKQFNYPNEDNFSIDHMLWNNHFVNNCNEDSEDVIYFEDIEYDLDSIPYRKYNKYDIYGLVYEDYKVKFLRDIYQDFMDTEYVINYGDYNGRNKYKNFYKFICCKLKLIDYNAITFQNYIDYFILYKYT